LKVSPTETTGFTDPENSTSWAKRLRERRVNKRPVRSSGFKFQVSGFRFQVVGCGLLKFNS